MTTPIAPSTTPDHGPPPAAMFATLRIASSGLSAQSFKMEIIAQNLANAETTRTPGGGPYQRRTVSLEPDTAPSATSVAGVVAGVVNGIMGGSTGAAGALAPVTGSGTLGQDPESGGVRVAGINVDTSEGALVYDPGHPDADASGYVRMPNVNMTSELMDLMSTRRLFQANATVFEVAKSMLSEATQI